MLKPDAKVRRNFATAGAGKDSDGLHWFAVRVKPRHEKVVATVLRTKGYEELLPLYEKRPNGRRAARRAQLPLFPGYLFCRFEERCRLPILTTPGVLYILGNGKALIPVETEEIEAVRRCAEARINAEPWPYVRVGQRVEVQSGPLSGLNGLLVEVKGQRRLVISIQLLQRSVAAELDASSVVPV